MIPPARLGNSPEYGLMTSDTQFEIPYRKHRMEAVEFNLREYGNLRSAVVILAKDESRTIGAIVRDARPFAHEIWLFDGHSKDDTARLAEDAGAKVRLDPGRGKGSAIRFALDEVKTDIVILMDGDGSHDPGEIPAMVRPLIHSRADLCVGSRFTGGSDELSVDLPQLIRTIGNISMNIAVNMRWGVRLTDTLNGFRAVRREAALSIGLRENRHTIEQEMVMKMLRYGYKVMNTPTHEYARIYGKSHINIWREWPIFVGCVVRNVIFKRPPQGYLPIPSWPASSEPQPESSAD
ncbi:glycosyltransferase family 2 protein [Candidatus Sumerlaeota bacterium]|nr:glycosyltransferase family 2 protein [Candidatus Sumerlaeota bacterium]